VELHSGRQSDSGVSYTRYGNWDGTHPILEGRVPVRLLAAIAAPFLLINITEITTGCEVLKPGRLHGWHGPLWKKHVLGLQAQMEMRRISGGEIRGTKMEILIGADVGMRRISGLHSWCNGSTSR
jgi:hypothetical protein